MLSEKNMSLAERVQRKAVLARVAIIQRISGRIIAQRSGVWRVVEEPDAD